MNLKVIQRTLLLVTTLIGHAAFGQTTLYNENFTGQNGKGAIGGSLSITIDTSGVDWAVDTLSVDFQNSDDYIQVVNEKIEFRDTEGNAKWISPAITISNLNTLTLSIELSEVGTMEGSDTLSVYYKIDNGSETEVKTINDDFSSHTLTDTALSGTGNNLYIIVYGQNGADAEKHRFDNVIVKGVCGLIPSESSNLTASGSLNTAAITWNAPDCADEVLIVAKLASTISGTPSGDGTAYSAASDFSGAGTAFDGGKVIYKGSGTNVTVTNLTSTSTYFYKIWSRTGSNWTTGIEINSNTSYVPKFIISEVADPSDDINARFVELFNADSVDINFSDLDYYICKETNGGGNFNCTQLSGSLAPGGTYVVTNNSTGFNTQFGQNPTGTFSNTAGNGDDAYALYIGGDNTTGTLLDIYGVIGQDGSGQTWEYEDKRAYRDSNLASPNGTWTASEWTIAGSNAAVCEPFKHASAYPQATFNSCATLVGGSYGSVIINGSSIAINASSETTIRNSIALTEGLLNLGSNNLNLGTAAGNCTLSDGSSSSYIFGGTVKSFVNDSSATYTFPMGTSSTEYSPVSIDFNSSTLASGAFIATTISDEKHPNFDQHVTSYLERNWTIEATGITNPVYAIQLYYVDGDVVGTESTILPVKYAVGNWTAPGEIGNNNVDTVGSGAINTASNFLSWDSLNSFSIFGGAGNGTPLPIELIAFEGKKMNENVLLTWETVSELNNDHFIVERIDENGSAQSIGSVPGNGTSNEMHNYSYMDYNPEIGVNYYRLSQVDYNGFINRHEVIALEIVPKINSNEIFAYFDNNSNQLKIRNCESSIDKLEILGINGQEVEYLISGFNDEFLEIDLNHIDHRVYFLSLKSEVEAPKTLKFIR